MLADYNDIPASKKLAITYESVVDYPENAAQELTAFCGRPVSLHTSQGERRIVTDELFDPGLTRIAKALHGVLLASMCNSNGQYVE